jgi:hypothetical protein
LIEGVPADVELEVFDGQLTERFVRRRDVQLIADPVVSTDDTRPIVAGTREMLELEFPALAARSKSTVDTSVNRARDDEIRAQLARTRTTTLAGTLPAAIDFEPCVALQDERGRALWLRALGALGWPFEKVAETGARGRYFLRDIPIGPVILLVGTRAELERGEPRWTTRMDVGAR